MNQLCHCPRNLPYLRLHLRLPVFVCALWTVTCSSRKLIAKKFFERFFIVGKSYVLTKALKTVVIAFYKRNLAMPNALPFLFAT